AEGKSDQKARELGEKLQQALLVAAKVSFNLTPGTEKATQGLDFPLKSTIVNRGTLSLQAADLHLTAPKGWESKDGAKLPWTIEPGQAAKGEFSITLDPQVPPTLAATAHISDLDYLEPQVGGILRFSFKELAEPLQVSARTRVEIAPAIDLEVSPNNIPVNVLDAGQTDSYPLQVKISSNLRTPLKGRISLAQSQTVRAVPETQQIALGPLSNGIR